MSEPSAKPSPLSQIFLSSGQKPEERVHADAIAAKLREEFRVFVSTEIETPQELLEVIYPALLDSDYFVFVDFCREPITKKSAKKPEVCRGSLYSHQELALAFFLKMDFATFHEEGVEIPAGMSSTIMGNGTHFTRAERSKLPDTIYNALMRKVREGIWSNTTRNQLALEVVPRSAHEVQHGARHLECYHIRVRNLHHHKRATHCNVYLEKLTVNGQERKLKPVEFKWRLTPIPYVSIWSAGSECGNAREFDAFVIEQGSPNKVVFESFTDAPKADWTFQDQGEYHATYVVQSDQFPDARATIRFRFSGGTTVELL